MKDTRFQWIPEGGPRIVTNTKSDTQGWKFLCYNDVQDIGSSKGMVMVGGWGFRSKDQNGGLVGTIT
jgi:hypothetical protein